ncbi:MULTISPECIES: histidinol-phosphatase HisJ family protein [Dethiosulfovibrio]|uniref:Histidinol-phosphatase n=2 Tax=Dethiosulfovibrio TaxID=47054 RepID=A0ABS9EV91_9BACT|nr:MULTISPECIES: histidinol-phosphatase HisJ family protein [Dethiosulfovibrio]MCF4115180.1 histidinol-phosphatase HisJ family protein [Dethiosulfovibrio russensis]MCF4143643.1 histidinol-phosphatase HisJ family protein [Dethiosulfovibrio marinus]MCF4146091.1 histidinol-phosphatase HisJ family protein [Dethiosulfovibrio acidaminovorans]
MLRSDYHVHTSFSGDCDEPLDRVLQRACDLGLKEIAITDHMDLDFPSEAVNFDLDVPSYLETLVWCRARWVDRIKLRVGLEVGLDISKKDRIASVLENNDWDFVIGSLHCVDGKSMGEDGFFKGKTRDEAHGRYFEAMLDSVKAFSGFSVVGHMDFVRRYGAGVYGDRHSVIDRELHKDRIDEILRELVKRGIGLELNTSGLRYGLDAFHPGDWILRRYRELGGEMITVGSDAHRLKDIADDFFLAEGLLEALGFRYTCSFQGRTPRFYSLAA